MATLFPASSALPCPADRNAVGATDCAGWQAGGQRTLRQTLARASIGAALVLLAVMAWPLATHRVPTRDDLGSYHLPVRAFYAEQLRAGESFDWMPSLYCGYFVTGEGQVGSYHPWHWLLYRWLPLETAFNLELWSVYPLLWLGSFLFFRRLLVRAGVAWYASLLYAFGSFALLRFVHTNAVAVVAHLPWLLWAIWHMAGSARPARWAGLIACLTGSQLLLGYPQYVWFSLLAEVALLGWIMVRDKSPRRLAGWWLAGILVGVLVGAVQLAPTFDALKHAARRTADADFANTGALHPLNLVQLVAPYLMSERTVGGNTHECGMYLGAVPLALLVWLRSHPPVGRRRTLAMALLIAAALTFALALGRAGVLYQLQTVLPVVGNFRCPSRYLVLCQLALAGLVGVALLEMLDRIGTDRPQKRQSLAVLVALSLIAAGVGVAAQGRPWCGSLPGVLAGPALTIAAVWLVMRASRGGRLALAALAMFTAIDLGAYGLSYAVFPETYRLEHYKQLIDCPPESPQGRVALDLQPPNAPGPRVGNQITLLGYHRVDGYCGLEPQRSLDYRQVETLRRAGVAWARRDALAEGTDGSPADTGLWQKLSDPSPRVRLLNEAAAATAGAAGIVLDRPGLLIAQTEGGSPSLLVVAESYHDGWRATVDGRPAAVIRAQGDFLGCRLEPGRHRVELRFRPVSLMLGKLGTAVGILLLAGLFWPRKAERRVRLP